MRTKEKIEKKIKELEEEWANANSPRDTQIRKEINDLRKKLKKKKG